MLRLQGDERLVALTRRGNQAAFEALVARYHSRLLAFCRHMLGSREDAEDVLQEVFAAAFNALLADERPINVRPWLYRIARNRSLNHLRKAQAVGVDSMDVHLADNGTTTADRVHRREEFRLLIGDVQQLPETQRTALLLRELDALSYEQIAEAMETTIPSVKSLLVRARVSLAEAAEARQLSCEAVRLELGEVAEGLRRLSAPARRHVRGCDRCANFRRQLKHTNAALAAVFPAGPLLLIKKLLLAHLGTTASAHSAASTAAAGSAATAAGSAATAAATGSAAGSAVSVSVTAIAGKAAAGLAAAAIVTAGAVEVDHSRTVQRQPAAVASARPAAVAPPAPIVVASAHEPAGVAPAHLRSVAHHTAAPEAAAAPTAADPAAQPPVAVTGPVPAPEQRSDSTTLPGPGATDTTGGTIGPSEPQQQPAASPAPAQSSPPATQPPPAEQPAPADQAPAPDQPAPGSQPADPPAASDPPPASDPSASADPAPQP